MQFCYYIQCGMGQIVQIQVVIWNSSFCFNKEKEELSEYVVTTWLAFRCLQDTECYV